MGLAIHQTACDDVANAVRTLRGIDDPPFHIIGFGKAITFDGDVVHAPVGHTFALVRIDGDDGSKPRVLYTISDDAILYQTVKRLGQ